MALRVHVARKAGFCFGVQWAVDAALEEAQKSDDVIMLGDIVHNEYVVQKIDEAGVQVVTALPEDGKATTLLLRAHGTAPQVYAEAAEKGYTIRDATCPLVLEIHEMVRQLDEEGCQIVVIGDHGHDEVIGITSQVSNAIVISCPDDVATSITRRYRKLGVVVQSTQNIENAQACLAALLPWAREIHYKDTICAPTKAYQREIRIMPLENDVMIIVGSRTSANTCRLTEISRSLNPRSYQVESAAGLESGWFAGAATVGISAGASTPDWLIKEVADAVKNMDTVLTP